MSKWKCGICGDEFENYYAQGFDDIIYCPLCYFKEEYKRTNEMLKNYKKQLQQKENIIKEVKSQLEYLETYSSKEDVFEDMSRRLNRIEKIIGDSSN